MPNNYPGQFAQDVNLATDRLKDALFVSEDMNGQEAFATVKRGMVQVLLHAAKADAGLAVTLNFYAAIGGKRELVEAQVLHNAAYVAGDILAFEVPVPYTANEAGLEAVSTGATFVATAALVWFEKTGGRRDNEGTGAMWLNAPNAYGAAFVFTAPASTLDVFCQDNDLVFCRSHDGTNYGGEVVLPAGCMYSVDVSCRAIKVKNATATKVARYQIVGWV